MADMMHSIAAGLSHAQGQQLTQSGRFDDVCVSAKNELAWCTSDVLAGAAPAVFV